MRVLIYGGGSVGLGVASALVAAGAAGPANPVTIVARPATVEALRRRGIVRRGLLGDADAPPEALRPVASIDEMPDAAEGEVDAQQSQSGDWRSQFAPPFDVVLVCVKAYDTGAAAADLARRPDLLGARGLLVLLQNGWGNAEMFAERFPRERIYNGRVITGFHRPEPHRDAPQPQHAHLHGSEGDTDARAIRCERAHVPWGDRHRRRDHPPRSWGVDRPSNHRPDVDVVLVLDLDVVLAVEGAESGPSPGPGPGSRPSPGGALPPSERGSSVKHLAPLSPHWRRGNDSDRDRATRP